MAYTISVLYMILLPLCQFIDNVPALDSEAILGGLPGRQEHFTHHVSVLFRTNSSHNYFPICGGGIISKDFVLSAAPCFVKNPRKLRNMTFYILAGADNLNTFNGLIIEVDVIYVMSEYDPEYNYNNIALLKLVDNLIEDDTVSTLRLPTENQKFNTNFSLIAGYSYSWVESKLNPDTRKYERVYGGGDNLLKFGIVMIMSADECRTMYPRINDRREMCALMPRATPEKPVALCSGDAGSALFIKDYIIAIAAKISAECDDRVHGSIYTKIYPYVDYIRSILKDAPPRNAIVHLNPHHVVYEARESASTPKSKSKNKTKVTPASDSWNEYNRETKYEIRSPEMNKIKKISFIATEYERNTEIETETQYEKANDRWYRRYNAMKEEAKNESKHQSTNTEKYNVIKIKNYDEEMANNEAYYESTSERKNKTKKATSEGTSYRAKKEKSKTSKTLHYETEQPVASNEENVMEETARDEAYYQTTSEKKNKMKKATSDEAKQRASANEINESWRASYDETYYQATSEKKNKMKKTTSDEAKQRASTNEINESWRASYDETSYQTKKEKGKTSKTLHYETEQRVSSKEKNVMKETAHDEAYYQATGEKTNKMKKATSEEAKQQTKNTEKWAAYNENKYQTTNDDEYEISKAVNVETVYEINNKMAYMMYNETEREAKSEKRSYTRNKKNNDWKKET